MGVSLKKSDRQAVFTEIIRGNEHFPIFYYDIEKIKVIPIRSILLAFAFF